METDKKTRSPRILPKVEVVNVLHCLENLVNGDFTSIYQSLMEKDPALFDWMTKQNAAIAVSGLDNLHVIATTFVVYQTLSNAMPNRRMPAVSLDIVKKVLAERPLTEYGMAQYIKDNYERINEENPVVAFMLDNVAKLYEFKPDVTISIVFAGITLYRMFEEQVLNTN